MFFCNIHKPTHTHTHTHTNKQKERTPGFKATQATVSVHTHKHGCSSFIFVRTLGFAVVFNYNHFLSFLSHDAFHLPYLCALKDNPNPPADYTGGDMAQCFSGHCVRCLTLPRVMCAAASGSSTTGKPPDAQVYWTQAIMDDRAEFM